MAVKIIRHPNVVDTHEVKAQITTIAFSLKEAHRSRTKSGLCGPVPVPHPCN